MNSSDDADGGAALAALSVEGELIDNFILGHDTDGGAALATLEVGGDLLDGSGGLDLAGGGDGREGGESGEHGGASWMSGQYAKGLMC